MQIGSSKSLATIYSDTPDLSKVFTTKYAPQDN